MLHDELASATPKEVREAIRKGSWTKQTGGLASGFVQANLAILPSALAYDFLLFCLRNPKPCPVLDVTDRGSAVPSIVAPSADLRCDLPKYRVYRKGQLFDEPNSIEAYWNDDLVCFLLGCSYTFEHAFARDGIALRHWEQQRNVAMFRTNQACRSAGRFHGPLVVSMRPIPADQVARAVNISGRYASAHGSPVHVGSAESLGITDVAKPDWGDPVSFLPGDVPVFWACGVTPQAVALEAHLDLMITHAPGHMFITDVPITAVEQ